MRTCVRECVSGGIIWEAREKVAAIKKYIGLRLKPDLSYLLKQYVFRQNDVPLIFFLNFF